MPGINPIARLFGLFAVLAGGPLHAAGPDTDSQVSRDSVFIQRLLQQPITPRREDTHIAALVLYRTGNVKDGEALDEFEKRRLLAKFLGEPFESSGSLAQVIEAERTAEPIKQVVARALRSVIVSYASPNNPAPRVTPDSFEIPMLVRHTLHASAITVGVQIGTSDQRKPEPYYLFLTCRPTDAKVFDPDASHSALCRASDSREGTELGARALLERRIPAPLPVYSFMSREADLYGDYFRINDEARSAAMLAAASGKVAAAPCEDLGNCEQRAKGRAAARWAAARPGVLIAATIAGFLLAGFAASRVPPRTSTGWFANALSVLVIFVSLLALVVMFPVTAPGLGLEGILYAGFFVFGLVPHLVCVGIIGASMAGEGATRLRVFALTFGLITPALVWAAIVAFGH
jgi:hypothetical protein